MTCQPLGEDHVFAMSATGLRPPLCGQLRSRCSSVNPAAQESSGFSEFGRGEKPVVVGDSLRMGWGRRLVRRKIQVVWGVALTVIVVRVTRR